MNAITYIEPAAYDALVAKLDQRRILTDKMLRRMKNASLAEKIAIRTEIKALSESINALMAGE
jgi:hypothetical protein